MLYGVGTDVATFAEKYYCPFDKIFFTLNYYSSNSSVAHPGYVCSLESEPCFPVSRGL